MDGDDLNLFKIVLTFVVPYCVATYGAVSFRLKAVKPAQPRPRGE